MLTPSNCPPVIVTPDWVESPPAVEIETPPTYVDVPAFKDLMSPEKRASPVEILSPADEARPAEEIPPVYVDVPAFKALMRPENNASPVETVRPADEESPTCDTPPSKVEVPVPLTVTRFATSRFVVDAIGKIFLTDVDVATNDSAVTCAPKSPAPAEEICAPGDEVLIPRNPPAVKARRVVVAGLDPTLMTARIKSSVCSLTPRTTKGIERVEVASIVATALAKGAVVPTAN